MQQKQNINYFQKLFKLSKIAESITIQEYNNIIKNRFNSLISILSRQKQLVFISQDNPKSSNVFDIVLKRDSLKLRTNVNGTNIYLKVYYVNDGEEDSFQLQVNNQLNVNCAMLNMIITLNKFMYSKDDEDDLYELTRNDINFKVKVIDKNTEVVQGKLSGQDFKDLHL